MKESVPPLLNQMILTKLGLYCSERLSVDLYYLNEAIHLLLPIFDPVVIKEEYEKKFGDGSWRITMKKLRIINVKLSESKSFYDSLSDKSLLTKRTLEKAQGIIEETIQKIFKRHFYMTAMRISLLHPEVYNLFVFLVYHSSIQSQMIKSEFFKTIEQRDNRTIKMERKPHENNN